MNMSVPAKGSVPLDAATHRMTSVILLNGVDHGTTHYGKVSVCRQTAT